MKIGLSIVRCGEPQCSRLLSDAKTLAKFHCVHIANNVSPNHVAVNQTTEKCFNDGADWVLRLDGDMDLNWDIFWTAFNIGLRSRSDCIAFMLDDLFIRKSIGSLYIMTKAYYEATQGWKDSLVTDREADERARAAGFSCTRVREPHPATHFENPTRFQIFKRFFIRGMKFRQGYTDGLKSYSSMLSRIVNDVDRDLATRAYYLGYSMKVDKNPHDLPWLLEQYNDFLGNDGLVCGMCVWGDFPYHFHNGIHVRRDEERYRNPDQFDPKMKAAYINKLAISVGQRMRQQHKLFYLSPEPVDGVIAECQWHKLDSHTPHKNLYKLGMYNPEYLKHGKTFINFDLDNIILQDLDDMPKAVNKSNGFICRSEIGSIGQNIAGGDMIGYTKETGKKIWEWTKTNNVNLIPKEKSGGERYLYRKMHEVFPKWKQFWWEFLGEEAITGWRCIMGVYKSTTKINNTQITDKTKILSVWGVWAIHELITGYYKDKIPSWLSKWIKSYVSEPVPVGVKEAIVEVVPEVRNTDIIIWQLCRQSTSTRDLIKRAKSMHIHLELDPDGRVWYVRQQGDTVELKASPTIAHPNCLMVKQ